MLADLFQGCANDFVMMRGLGNNRVEVNDIYAAVAVGQALPCSDRCLANSSHSAVELNRERRPSSSCSVLLKFRPGRSVDGTGNTRSKAQVRVC